MSRRRVIAEGAMTRVEICPCGGCQLTIGPVTVTLQDPVLVELGETLAMAIRALRVQRAMAGHLEEPPGDDACGERRAEPKDPTDPN